MSTGDGNPLGRPFHRRLYYEREGEKDVYTVLLLIYLASYQSRTARIPFWVLPGAVMH